MFRPMWNILTCGCTNKFQTMGSLRRLATSSDNRSWNHFQYGQRGITKTIFSMAKEESLKQRETSWYHHPTDDSTHQSKQGEGINIHIMPQVLEGIFLPSQGIANWKSIHWELVIPTNHGVNYHMSSERLTKLVEDPRKQGPFCGDDLIPTV